MKDIKNKLEQTEVIQIFDSPYQDGDNFFVDITRKRLLKAVLGTKENPGILREIDGFWMGCILRGSLKSTVGFVDFLDELIEEK